MAVHLGRYDALGEDPPPGLLAKVAQLIRLEADLACTGEGVEGVMQLGDAPAG